MNTKTETVDIHQQLMDQAYARWQAAKGMGKQEFWDTLDSNERFAVFTGNLNYQVCNGGFSQWWGNSYAEPEVVDYLIRNCAVLGTPAGAAVADLVRRFKAAVRGRNERDLSESAWEVLTEKLGELDTEFYKVNDAFLVDCRAELTKRMAKAEG